MKEVAWKFLEPFKVETYVMLPFFHRNNQECKRTKCLKLKQHKVTCIQILHLRSNKLHPPIHLPHLKDIDHTNFLFLFHSTEIS